MAIDLTKPISWKLANQEEQEMLQTLQGNILKGHGRPLTINIFFKINPAQASAMKKSLRKIANFHLTSAMRQLQETQEYHQYGKVGDTFASLFLSSTGYVALGLPTARPTNLIFVNGMQAASSLTALNDPPVASWETPFQGQIDGMLLLGDSNVNRLRVKRDEMINLLTKGGGTIIHQQKGEALNNQAGEGIEHFGYVDGRSQPLLLKEDIEKESAEAGISDWNPAFPLETALIPDPGAPTGLGAISFGSYFVFRKLEQDVKGFKLREQQLADALGFTGETRELAGALAVGRFEDGTPVTLADEALGLTPPNNFGYKGDPGARCPFHAHIRKVNPRGTGGAEPEPAERKHLMPRRGIPYEDVARKTHPSTLPEVGSLAEFNAKVAPLLPTGGVGLLFMAYNGKIEQQFQFTQQTWANNPSFPLGVPPPPPGLDPVIGVGPVSNQNWPRNWGSATPATAFSLQGFVKMRGGEYFFAPSLAFLKAL